LFQNHFIASLRLDKKEYDNLGKLIKKTYHKATIAYERILECKDISDRIKRELEERHNGLNRVKLQRERDNLIRKLWKIR